MSDWQPSGRDIVGHLNGRWGGKHGMCRCPAHDDSSPSLSVTQLGSGLVLVKCFAGCEQLSVIAALRELGLWPSRDEEGHPSYVALKRTPRDNSEADLEERKRIELARGIWKAAQPIASSQAESYLRARAVGGVLPPTLRFAPTLKHTASKRELPALIAAVQDGDGHVIAVQRTYLAGARKADVVPNKVTLGPMRDGAVRLARADRVLGIAEGIETALSAKQMYSLPVWASLGAARMSKLKLPEIVDTVVIFADNGQAGMDAAKKAESEYLERGYAVEIEAPPGEVKDHNDWLQSQRTVAGAA